MVVVTEEQALEELRQRMRGERSGDVEVLDVRIEYLPGPGMELYVWVGLVLSDPAPGLRTWPREEREALIDRAWGEVARLPIGTRVTVQLGSRPTYGVGSVRIARSRAA